MSTDRIAAIIDFIPACKTLADVGCDHGFVAAAAAKKADRVYATDISEECLAKARLNCMGLNNVVFVLSDGLDGVERVDCAVICGMGGKLIAEILSRIDYKPYLVLGPQKNVDSLRAFLSKSGYEIVRDEVVKDGRKFYDIICARGGRQTLDETQLKEGVFYKTPSPARRERLERKLVFFSTLPPTESNLQTIYHIKEALKWQN